MNSLCEGRPFVVVPRHVNHVSLSLCSFLTDGRLVSVSCVDINLVQVCVHLCLTSILFPTDESRLSLATVCLSFTNHSFSFYYSVSNYFSVWPLVADSRLFCLFFSERKEVLTQTKVCDTLCSRKLGCLFLAVNAPENSAMIVPASLALGGG